jgi:hypothetical protein
METKKVEVEPTPVEPPKEPLVDTNPPTVSSGPVKPAIVGEQLTGNAAATELTITPDMIVVALADFEATADDQLALEEGQLYVRITEDYGNGWSLGCTMDGSKTGVFPQTYVEPQSAQ